MPGEYNGPELSNPFPRTPELDKQSVIAQAIKQERSLPELTKHREALLKLMNLMENK